MTERKPHHGKKLALAILLALWGFGFWRFYQLVPSVTHPTAAAATTDAIVVLTGGTGRVRYGFEQLEKGKAKVLFISGVGKKVRFNELAEVYQLKGRELELASSEAAVALGYKAIDTVGNARETAQWIREQGYSSLRLVTSNYHMPRSLMEFKAAMPNVTIVADPVFPGHSPEESARWKVANSLRLLFLEYHKYILRAAWLRFNPAQAR